MRPQTLLATGATSAALLLTGCGITNPYANTATNSTPARSAASTTTIDHDPAHERGGTIAARARDRQDTLGAPAARPTAQAAVARYAQLYTNWTATNVSATESNLATISLGAARAQALQAAASYRHDATLLDSQIANNGSVVAITRGRGSAAGQWVVVTREQTTGKGDYQGLPAQLHVTFVQLTKTPHGWVVSAWSPQS